MVHITKVTATIKATALINSKRMTKIELAELIGISRPSLDRRLINNNWKKGEMQIIKNL
jgi:hypothetical protein